MKILAGIDGGPQQPDALALADRLARGSGGTMSTVHLTEHHISVPRALQEHAAREAADVLVVGSCHRGPVGRALFGSVGDRLLRGAPCAVAVAPRGYGERESGIHRIAVAYDETPESKVALDFAVRLAEETSSTLEIISAVEPTVVPAAGMPTSFPVVLESTYEGRRAALRRLIAELPASLDAHAELVEGSAVPSIAGKAHGADLLVAGSRGHGPFGSTVLGSVARGLIHTATCPVVVVPRSAASGNGRDKRHTDVVTMSA